MKLWILTAIIPALGWILLSGQQAEKSSGQPVSDKSTRPSDLAPSARLPAVESTENVSPESPSRRIPETLSHRELTRMYSSLSDEEIDSEIDYINSNIEQNRLIELANTYELTPDEKELLRNYFRKKVALQGIKVTRMVNKEEKNGLQTDKG